MKVTLEKLPASQVSLEIELPLERVKGAYEQAVQKLSREANIPGFRKGKVPKQVIIQQFGSRRLKATVLEDLMNASLKQATEQEKIEAIGEFELKSSFDELLDRFDPEQSLTFSVCVDVQPEITLTQYQGLTVQAEEVNPDLSKVDRLLEDKQREIAALIPVEDRPAQEGDVAILDFQGKLVLAEGAELTESDRIAQEIVAKAVKDFQVDLITDRFVPGFVAGIVGMNPGETKDLPVEFPDDYAQPELANKSVLFTVTLQDLKARELPDLNDDFAKEISEFETFAELRESLENRQTREAAQHLRSNKENALSAELLKHVEADLPATLINREVNYLLNQTANQLQSQGMDINALFTKENLPFLRQQAQPQAINQLKLTLALHKIAELESIQLDPAIVRSNVQSIMSQYQGKESVDPEALKMVVQEDLLKEKVFDWLEANSTIELVPEGSLQLEQAEEDLETLSASEDSSSMTDETQAVVTEAETDETQAVVTETEAEETFEVSSTKTLTDAEVVSETDLQELPDAESEQPTKTKQLKGRRSVKAKQEAGETDNG